VLAIHHAWCAALYIRLNRLEAGMNLKTVIGGIAATGAAGALAVGAIRRGTAVEDPQVETQEQLQRHVGDLLALTRDLCAMLDKQLETTDLARFPGAQKLIQQLRDSLDPQAADLARELNSLGGSYGGSRVKSMASSLGGSAMGVFERWRAEPVSRMLRDDYTGLALGCISYTMLHTTGLSLHSDRVADLAQKHMSELTQLMIRVGEEMPNVVLAELARDSLPVDVTIGREAVEHTQKAWAQSASAVHG
jgi:hypothetical protein